MKTCFTVLITMTFILSSCVKEIEQFGLAESNKTLFTGRVVEGTIHKPLPNIMLLVTNGIQTNTMATTNENGRFAIELDYSKIDQSYYLLFDGGSEEIRKKQELKGIAVEEYDYGDVVLYTLPSFQYEGNIYQVAPDSRSEMTWDNANDYCAALTYCNLSDWRLPTKDELRHIYAERSSISGFCFGNYWSSDRTDDYYTGYGYYHDYYYLSFGSGEVYNMAGANRIGVRPIRRMDD